MDRMLFTAGANPSRATQARIFEMGPDIEEILRKEAHHFVNVGAGLFITRPPPTRDS